MLIYFEIFWTRLQFEHSWTMTNHDTPWRRKPNWSMYMFVRAILNRQRENCLITIMGDVGDVLDPHGWEKWQSSPSHPTLYLHLFKWPAGLLLAAALALFVAVAPLVASLAVLVAAQPPLGRLELLAVEDLPKVAGLARSSTRFQGLWKFIRLSCSCFFKDVEFFRELTWQTRPSD